MKNLHASLLFCVWIFSGSIFAQKQFGVAAMATVIHSISHENANRTSNPYVTGLRGEFLKTKLGIGRVRLAYLGIAISAFPSSKEDVTVTGHPKNIGIDKKFTGTRTESEEECMLRCGFEIPQHWSDFLFLNFGFAAGLDHGKEKYDLQDFDPQLYYLSHQESTSFFLNGYGYLISEFLSGFYEFNKFYVWTQIEYADNVNIYFTEDVSFRFNAGIYYKLNQSE
jgi:hypothetical protein